MKNPRTPDELRAALEYLDDEWARPRETTIRFELSPDFERWADSFRRMIEEGRAGLIKNLEGGHTLLLTPRPEAERIAYRYNWSWRDKAVQAGAEEQGNLRPGHHALIYDGSKLIDSWDGDYGYDEVMKGARAMWECTWPPKDRSS